MPQTRRRLSLRTLLAAGVAAAITLSPVALSHFDDKQVMLSYRQSWFAMLGTNFGPMVAMLKGEMPWDQARLAEHAKQLEQLSAMDITRGFGPGTDKGTTRAKPEIWQNQDDFTAKMKDMHEASVALVAAVNGGDRKAIGAAIGATGKSCKACHDEYKSEDYLY